MAVAFSVAAASACGGPGPDSTDGRAGAGAGEAPGETVDTIDVRLRGGPERAAGSALELRLVLRNPGSEDLRLDFSDGQRFDFLVRDAGSEVAWRWSQGRFFSQALGSEVVAPGDSLTYGVTLNESLEPGSYTVVGVVTARERSLRDSVEVEVGGGR